VLLGGTVCVVGVLSIWWCLWRGGLPSVDRCAALLVDEDTTRPQRMWVSMGWGWVAWLLTIQPLVLGLYPLWIAPVVVVAWGCLLFSPPSVLRTRVAVRLSRRVRDGLVDSSPLVRGWAAAVVLFVVGEHPDRSVLRWRLTVGSSLFDGSSLLLRRRSRGTSPVAPESASFVESRDTLFRLMETLRLSSAPPLVRDRTRLLLSAVRLLWESPVLEQSLKVSFMGNQLMDRSDTLVFLSSAWFVSGALADQSLREPRLFDLTNGVMMVSASEPDAPFSNEPCLRGVSRAELRTRPHMPASDLLARADLAVALSSSWHVPDPEYRFGIALGRTDNNDSSAVLDLIDAVWALLPSEAAVPHPAVDEPSEASQCASSGASAGSPSSDVSSGIRS
jgi:hypothetical protein